MKVFIYPGYSEMSGKLMYRWASVSSPADVNIPGCLAAVGVSSLMTLRLEYDLKLSCGYNEQPPIYNFTFKMTRKSY